MQMNIHLNFQGNCAEAFDFYKKVFGAKEAFAMKYGDAPQGMPIPPNWKDKIMHTSIPLGNGRLMGRNAGRRTGINVCIQFTGKGSAHEALHASELGGNCEEAFLFYEKHLGGKITMMMKQNQLPQQHQAPPGLENAVIHARIDIAGVELIGNDVPPNYFQSIRSSYLYFALDSTESADKTWNILAEGGEVTMPISETFFATRFGQLRDKFGVLWSIIHPKPM